MNDQVAERAPGQHVAETSQNQRLRKRLLPNLIANGGVFALNLLLGIWYTPYLVRHLGVAAYGLVALANSLTSYLSLISLSLNGGAGRFLALDLGRRDFDSANRTFNTVFFGNLGLIALTLFPIVGITLIAPHWFDVPSGQESHAQWLFGATLLSYSLTFLQSSFSVSSWARNRFDLRNIVVAIHHLVRVGVVVVIFRVTTPLLWHVGAGIFGATLVGLAGDYWLWRRLTPQLRVRVAWFDRLRVRQLFDMGGWLVVNQVGTLLFLKIDLIIANTLLGATIAGEYGSVLVFSTMLRQLSATVAAVLTPTVLAMYARGDLYAVNRISQQSVKFMGLALALPIGLICGLARPLLSLWLGPSFESLSVLLIVVTGHLVITLALQPLFGLNVALNRVSVPGVVTLVMGALNVGLAVAFVKLGWGALGIAASGAITLMIKNTFFTPIYAAIIQKLPWWRFLTLIPLIVGSTLFIGGLAYAANHFIEVHSWLGLIALAGGIGVLYVAVVCYWVLSEEDRKLLLSLVPNVGSLTQELSRTSGE